MKYNDDQIANDESFAKIAEAFKNKMKYEKYENNIPFTESNVNVSITAQLENVVSIIEKSEGYLVHIKNFLPNSRYNGKLDINSLNKAIELTRNNKEKLLKLIPDFTPTTAKSLYIPSYYNYHHCFCEFCWCQFDLLKALLLLRLIRGYNLDENILNEIALSELEILQIPLKLVT